MAYAHELLAEGREEEMQQGVQRGKVETVEGFVKAGATWEIIESATGLAETWFRALKESLAADIEST